MMKRNSLALLFILAAGAGHTVAQDLNSLNVIVNLTNDFKRFSQKEQKGHPQSPPPRILRIGSHGK